MSTMEFMRPREHAAYSRKTVNQSIRSLKKALRILSSRLKRMRYVDVHSTHYWLKLALRNNLREVDRWLSYFYILKNQLAVLEASAAGAQCACCGYLGLKNAYLVVVNGRELYVGPECARHFPIRVCRDMGLVPYSPRREAGMD